MSLAKNIITNIVNKLISTEQSLFYKRHNHCSLCSSVLSVEIEQKQTEKSVYEKVSCLHCHVTISTKDHPLN